MRRVGFAGAAWGSAAAKICADDGSPPKIPTVELTEKSAKNAVDAYLKLRATYGNKIPPANKMQSIAEGTAAMGDVHATVTGHGFGNTADWQKAITAVALAYGFNKDGNPNDLDRQIAEMEANGQIPAAYKKQLIDSLKSVRPSDHNLTVVKALLADSTYGDKIRSIAE
jgi:hypothetical protein